MLEREGRGLNLTGEVRDGILHHTGPGRPATLEGQVVRLMDRVAYVNHDIDDALRAGVLLRTDLPADEVAALGDSTSRRLTTLVSDVVEASRASDEIRQTADVGAAFLRLRAFMFRNVYLAPPAGLEAERAGGVVRALFTRLCERPELLPPSPEPDPVTRATDFVAGMTDRYRGVHAEGGPAVAPAAPSASERSSNETFTPTRWRRVTLPPVDAYHDTIDLSSATEGELRELSGVGPALARRIVAWREEHGGFESVDQLAEVRGISPRVLEDLRPHVRADPFTYITTDAMLDPDRALAESLRAMNGAAPELDEGTGSPVARLWAFATENVGNAALIGLIVLVELFIILMLVRAL